MTYRAIDSRRANFFWNSGFVSDVSWPMPRNMWYYIIRLHTFKETKLCGKVFGGGSQVVVAEVGALIMKRLHKLCIA